MGIQIAMQFPVSVFQVVEMYCLGTITTAQVSMWIAQTILSLYGVRLTEVPQQHSLLSNISRTKGGTEHENLEI